MGNEWSVTSIREVSKLDRRYLLMEIESAASIPPLSFRIKVTDRFGKRVPASVPKTKYKAHHHVELTFFMSEENLAQREGVIIDLTISAAKFIDLKVTHSLKKDPNQSFETTPAIAPR